MRPHASRRQLFRSFEKRTCTIRRHLGASWGLRSKAMALKSPLFSLSIFQGSPKVEWWDAAVFTAQDFPKVHCLCTKVRAPTTINGSQTCSDRVLRDSEKAICHWRLHSCDCKAALFFDSSHWGKNGSLISEIGCKSSVFPGESQSGIARRSHCWWRQRRDWNCSA